jgi:hypothetical protein
MADSNFKRFYPSQFNLEQAMEELLMLRIQVEDAERRLADSRRAGDGRRRSPAHFSHTAQSPLPRRKTTFVRSVPSKRIRTLLNSS